MSEQQEAPSFSIEKLYLKDLSVEVPNAPEVFLDVSFGNVPGQYGHASACQVVHLLAVLQDAAVKFLNIHCLLNK